MKTPRGNPWFARVLTLCVVAVAVAALNVPGVVAASGAPPSSVPDTTPPTPADPDGTGARVVLVCGSDAANRIVASFEAPVEPGQTAALYVGVLGGVLDTVTVGQVVPAATEFFWQVVDVFLGPWPVGTVYDSCDPQPPDGSGARVTLRCGTTAAWRQIVSFQASVDAGQEVLLYVATPQSGGEALTVVMEDEEVPAFSEFRWSIRNVELGPWPVETVDDSCGVLDSPLPPGQNGGRVVLVCGSRPTTRVIASFEAPVEPDRTAVLTLATTGGGTPVSVGDEVPTPPGLVWSIDGVSLGPWTVQTVIDQCESSGAPGAANSVGAPNITGGLAATGPRGSMPLLVAATALVGTGLALIKIGLRGDRRPGHQER